MTRGPYLGYPWNHREDSVDRVDIGTTIVDSRNIGRIKYNIRKLYPQNKVINIKLSNTSNENIEDFKLHTSITTNKDMMARFKQYDETNPKMLRFLQQRMEFEKDVMEKHGMTLYPFPPSVNSYTLTPLKYLKLKTREKSLPAREDSEYDDVISTYKNSDDKISDDKKMITISGLDLMALLSQLRAENRNYSMQILV